jgi:hypothetical protein
LNDAAASNAIRQEQPYSTRRFSGNRRCPAPPLDASDDDVTEIQAEWEVVGSSGLPSARAERGHARISAPELRRNRPTFVYLFGGAAFTTRQAKK